MGQGLTWESEIFFFTHFNATVFSLCSLGVLQLLLLSLSLFFRFYLVIHERDTQREAETQAEGEAGSNQGAQWWDSILGLQDHTPS